MKEFNLSDKIGKADTGDSIQPHKFIYVNHVKEFIKKLKDYLEIVKALDSGITNTLVDGKEDEELMKYTEKIVALVVDEIEKEINKSAGEELK